MTVSYQHVMTNIVNKAYSPKAHLIDSLWKYNISNSSKFDHLQNFNQNNCKCHQHYSANNASYITI